MTLWIFYAFLSASFYRQTYGQTDEHPGKTRIAAY